MTSSLLQHRLSDGRRVARRDVGQTASRARSSSRHAGCVVARSLEHRPRPGAHPRPRTGAGLAIVTGAGPSNRNTVASTRHTRSSRPAFGDAHVERGRVGREGDACRAARRPPSASRVRGSRGSIVTSACRARRVSTAHADPPASLDSTSSRLVTAVVRGAECRRRSSSPSRTARSAPTCRAASSQA